MKLPHLLADEESAHLILLTLCVVNLLLFITIFFILTPSAKKSLLRVIPISPQTPIVDFTLVSPKANSIVSGTASLTTTLTNGPKITSAELFVDGSKIQAVTSAQTQQLILYWDTTKHQDGRHNLLIEIGQSNGKFSSLSTSLNVQNNVSRSIGQR